LCPRILPSAKKMRRKPHFKRIRQCEFQIQSVFPSPHPSPGGRG
jgi:hypothetical protein